MKAWVDGQYTEWYDGSNPPVLAGGTTRANMFGLLLAEVNEVCEVDKVGDTPHDAVSEDKEELVD